MKTVYGVREAAVCADSPVIRDLLHAGRVIDPFLGKSDKSPLVLPYSEEDVELILSYRFGSTSVTVFSEIITTYLD